MSAGVCLGGQLGRALLGDVLGEHFGDACELVGTVLLDSPNPLRFSEILKACTIQLTLPVSLQAYSSAALAKSVSAEEVRDALLVLIQHDLVEVTGEGSLYFMRHLSVASRLDFGKILALVERECGEIGAALFSQIVKTGRAKKNDLITIFGPQAATVLDHLLNKRFICKPGDSIVIVSKSSGETAAVVPTAKRGRGGAKKATAAVVPDLPDLPDIPVSFLEYPSTLPPLGSFRSISSGDVLLTANMAELRLEVFKEDAVDFVTHRLGAEVGEVFRVALRSVRLSGNSRPSCDWLTADDLLRWDTDLKRDRLIRCLSALSKSGDCKFLSSRLDRPAQQTVAQPSKRKRGAVDPVRVEMHSTEGGEGYRVDWKSLCVALETDIIQSLVAVRVGSQEGRRIFNLLRSSKRTAPALDCGQISEACLLGREHTQKLLHLMSRDGVIQMQEGGGTTARGGRAGYFPSSAGNNWQYLVDLPKAREVIARDLCRATLNLRRRFRFEVHRETRLDDRAHSLTDQAREYLKVVTDAQDALEAQSIKAAQAYLILTYALAFK